MSSFAARLRMPGRSRLPLGVEVDISRERMTLTSGDQKVGDWALDQLEIKALSDGFHITVDDEQIILNVTDSTRFAVELGIAGRPPRRLVELLTPDLPRNGLSSIKGQLNYQPAKTVEEVASSSWSDETIPEAGQGGEIRRRISEVAEALASDSVSPAQAFAGWIGLLKEINYRYGQGSIPAELFYQLNTELLDLIPGPTPVSVVPEGS
ncbi:MAG TPA: hypothetical protein VK990_08315 [Acidimicrobiia bacterium]|nr:hypothetical protein [Acidimicrobiia bacterium]